MNSRKCAVWIDSIGDARWLGGLVSGYDEVVFCCIDLEGPRIQCFSGVSSKVKFESAYKFDFEPVGSVNYLYVSSSRLYDFALTRFRDNLQDLIAVFQGIFLADRRYAPFLGTTWSFFPENFPRCKEILISSFNRPSRLCRFKSKVRFVDSLKHDSERSDYSPKRLVFIAHKSDSESDEYLLNWINRSVKVLKKFQQIDHVIWYPHHLDLDHENGMPYKDIEECVLQLKKNDTLITPLSSIQVFALGSGLRSIVFEYEKLTGIAVGRDGEILTQARTERELDAALRDESVSQVGLERVPKCWSPRIGSGKGEIVLWGRMPAKGYSGGRYHALMIAEGMSSLGYRVTVVTDKYPYFFDDMVGFSGHYDIDFHLARSFSDPSQFPSVKAEHIFLIPGMDREGSMYHGCLMYASAVSAQLHLVSFETPNWFNLAGNTNRDPELWRFWNECSRYCRRIIATTKTGETYARGHYELGDGQDFYQLYAPINTPIVEEVKKIDKAASNRKEIVAFFPRAKYAEHKGFREILDLFDTKIAGWKVVFLCGQSLPDEGLMDIVTKCASANGFSVDYIVKANDNVKLKVIYNASVLLFPSSFEGYGYPPLEALSLGTPCIAFDLPVLRETCGDLLIYAELGNWVDFKDKLDSFVRNPESFQFSACPEMRLSSFEHFCDSLEAFIDSVEADSDENPIYQYKSFSVNTPKFEELQLHDQNIPVSKFRDMAETEGAVSIVGEFLDVDILILVENNKQLAGFEQKAIINSVLGAAECLGMSVLVVVKKTADVELLGVIFASSKCISQEALTNCSKTNFVEILYRILRYSNAKKVISINRFGRHPLELLSQYVILPEIAWLDFKSFSDLPNFGISFSASVINSSDTAPVPFSRVSRDNLTFRKGPLARCALISSKSSPSYSFVPFIESLVRAVGVDIASYTHERYLEEFVQFSGASISFAGGFDCILSMPDVDLGEWLRIQSSMHGVILLEINDINEIGDRIDDLQSIFNNPEKLGLLRKSAFESAMLHLCDKERGQSNLTKWLVTPMVGAHDDQLIEMNSNEYSPEAEILPKVIDLLEQGRSEVALEWVKRADAKLLCSDLVKLIRILYLSLERKILCKFASEISRTYPFSPSITALVGRILYECGLSAEASSLLHSGYSIGNDTLDLTRALLATSKSPDEFVSYFKPEVQIKALDVSEWSGMGVAPSDQIDMGESFHGSGWYDAELQPDDCYIRWFPFGSSCTVRLIKPEGAAVVEFDIVSIRSERALRGFLPKVGDLSLFWGYSKLGDSCKIYILIPASFKSDVVELEVALWDELDLVEGDERSLSLAFRQILVLPANSEIFKNLILKGNL
ncbi:MAG: glycosyltransferase [Opitutales bacterium]|nr:glycosyltransferase [Opitutales bacterium]